MEFKNECVRDLIESVGAKLIYLPPYSPDLSPIEKFWSKVKHYIKKFSPRPAAEFHEALISAIDEVEDEGFEEWYDAGGYLVA